MYLTPQRNVTYPKDLIQSVTIAVFSAKTQKVQARYVFDVKVLAAEEDVTTTSLSSLDNQLRANLCRLLSCGSVAADPGRDRESEKEDGELSFEFIVRTKGVRTGVQWMPADGKERREFQGGGVAMPLKDADCFATTLQLSSRVEFEATEWPHS